MWATTPIQPTFTIPSPTPPTFSFSKPPPPTIHLRRSTTAAASSKDTTGLGQAVLTAINSSPSNNKFQQKHKNKPKEKQGDNNKNNLGSDISGSDILRALQRANAKKANIKKRNQQVKDGNGSELGSANGKKKVVDYDKIRPLSIKSDWGTRLNDLEKRLQEFLPH